MRKIFFLASLLCSSSAFARELELPSLSPAAKISQTVGLTELSIEYSSPSVRGRQIWGQVVPFNEVWRAGANRATKISFSKDVTVGTIAVPAGTYAIFMIPQQKGNWTVILNKNPNQAGTADYKKELDAVRLEVKPEAIATREHLAYTIPNFTSDMATVALEWEKVHISIPVKVATDSQVADNLQWLEQDGWRAFNSAARYALEQKKDYDLALKYADMSLQQKDEWFNNWTKAQTLAAKGKFKDAYPFAEKAQDLGAKNPQSFFFSEEVKKALSDWKAKKS